MHQSKMVLVGRLVGDAETRQVGDSMVTNFTVAVDTNQRLTAAQRAELGVDNEYATATAFWRCTTWGNWGSSLVGNGSLMKGVMVSVQGEVEVDPVTHAPKTFTRNNGEVGTSLNLRLDQGNQGLTVLSSRADRERLAGGATAAAPVAHTAPQEVEEEIIF